MSPRLTNITACDIQKVLKKLGYTKTVIKPRTFKGILRDMGLTFEELSKILKG